MSSSLQTKEAFLAQLRECLKRLPPTEIDSAVSYYEEYIEDAGEENLSETLASLGSPREIAATILRDRAFQEIKSSPPSAKRGISTVWMVILAIFASPIALPVAIVFVALAFTLVIVLISLLFTLAAVLFSLVAAVGAVSFACLLAGLIYLLAAIPLMFQHMATGFFVLGIGLLVAGIGGLAGIGTVAFAKLSWKFTKEVFGRWLPRFVGKIFARRAKA